MWERESGKKQQQSTALCGIFQELLSIWRSRFSFAGCYLTAGRREANKRKSYFFIYFITCLLCVWTVLVGSDLWLNCGTSWSVCFWNNCIIFARSTACSITHTKATLINSVCLVNVNERSRTKHHPFISTANENKNKAGTKTTVSFKYQKLRRKELIAMR